MCGARSTWVLHEQPRGLDILTSFLSLVCEHTMEHDREEESGEMFSPNESGEYMPHVMTQ